MKLLAVVLLLLPLSTCWAAVVNNFTVSCPGFFATPKEVVSPPTKFNGDQFKQICQTLNDKTEFATFYDTANRIPVYSAYRFYGRTKCARKSGDWYIEPQLDNPAGGNNMATESAIKPQTPGDHQALNEHYKGSGYDKGHLAPVCHQNQQCCATATFTLTNAAPQKHSFNKKWFDYAESPVSAILKRECIDQGLRVYVVTGTVPGTETIENKVRIPSHFWSAFCCLDNNGIAKYSGAYIGENQEGSTVIPKRVQDLEDELSTLYQDHLKNNNPQTSSPRFILFGGDCYAQREPSKDLGDREPRAKKRKCEVQPLSTQEKISSKVKSKKYD